MFLQAHHVPKAQVVRIREPRDIYGVDPAHPILRLADWSRGTREAWQILNIWNRRGGTFIDVPEESFIPTLKP
jgi:hypothetical protein